MSEPQQWQPIETAPKDRSVLAYDPVGRTLTMIWNSDGSGWRADIHSYIRFSPTHWMPLPDPPEAA